MAVDKLKICSLNVRGLKNKLKRNALFSYLKRERYDIICLQETHVTEQDFDVWQRQWGGKCFFQQGTNRSKGETVLVSKHFAGEVSLEEARDRMLVLSVEHERIKLKIANVYAPNSASEKILFFRALEDYLEDISNGNLLLFGDFNCVMHNELDNISGRPHNQAEVAAFNESINALNLTDVWRSFHPEEKEFTWSRNSPFIARRLDYCFLSEDVLATCVSCEHSIVPNSDHKAVVVELNDNEFVRGPGFWRFNNSYLRNASFVEKMNDFLTSIITESVSLGLTCINTWELCKVEIRNFCTEFGKMLSCKKKNEFLLLQLELEELDKQISNNAEDEILQRKLIQVKQKLDMLHLDKARGAQTRARQKWIEEGERNTAYFCNLEKVRSKKKVITRLHKDSGEIITGQNEIMAEQVSFYKALYNQTTEADNVKEEADAFIENETRPIRNDRSLVVRRTVRVCLVQIANYRVN
jgi:exodeoxyribonuclease-3